LKCGKRVGTLLRGLVPPETNGAAPYPVGEMLAAAKRFLISCKPSNPEVMSKNITN
jgi:hypothetical protein